MPNTDPEQASLNIGTPFYPDFSGYTAPITGNPPPGTIPINQSAWRTGHEGPINLAGQGIYMYGSKPVAPQPLPWWMERNDQIEAQRRAEQESQVFSPQEYRDFYRRNVLNPNPQALNAIRAARIYQAEMLYRSNVNAGMAPEKAASISAAMVGSANAMDNIYKRNIQQNFQPQVYNVAPGVQMVSVGPGRFVQVRPPPIPRPAKPAVTTSEATRSAEIVLRSIDEQRKALNNPLNTDPDKATKLKNLDKEYNDIIGQLKGNIQAVGANTTGRTRVKDKRTGNEMWYKGLRSDIPTDRYQIVE